MTKRNKMKAAFQLRNGAEERYKLNLELDGYATEDENFNNDF